VKLLKAIVRRAIEGRGYHVFSRSFLGFDAMADFKVLLAGAPAPIVADVGGFLGGFAVGISSAIPSARVHSFEPAPVNFERLTAHTCRHPNITVVNLALGAEAGERDFHVNAAPATSSFFQPTADGLRQMPPGALECRAPAKARVARLDDYANEHGLGRIDLLKIDTQGYELQVLKGAQRLLEAGKVRIVYCEVLFRNLYEGQCSFGDIHSYLTAHRLAFAGFYDVARSPENDFMWADALYISPAPA